MTKQELAGIWNYYLSLERDLSKTSNYVEPLGQENVYSFEFLKLLILSCTEVESVLKLLCNELNPNNKAGDIGAYKGIVLTAFPKIVDAHVTVSRTGTQLYPFQSWDKQALQWWDEYQIVKHGRNNNFSHATYYNAVTALGALYILIFYLAKHCELSFWDDEAQYLTSDYCHKLLACAPEAKLPDFEVTTK